MMIDKLKNQILKIKKLCGSAPLREEDIEPRMHANERES
jgi:hypothetical protein